MDRTSKSVIAVSLLIVGLLLGTNYMVTDEPEPNWLLLTLLLLGGAFFFWLWIRRDERQAEEAAQQSLEEAERQIASLEEASQQAVMDSAKSAESRVEAALERAGIDMPEESEAEEMVEQDAIFDENKAPQDTTEDEPTTPSVVDDVTAPAGDDVIEGAQAGEPIAEKQVAESEAQKPISDDVAEVTPQDVEKADAADSSETDADEEVDSTEAVVEDISDADLREEEVEEVIDDESADAEELKTEAETTADDEPDDLTIIEGIGPAYQRYLKAAGITSFAQLAAMSEDEIETAVTEQGGRRAASMVSWAEQAQLAADGKWDELETLQDELMGGRR